MSTLYISDVNSGEIIAIDTTNPTGSISVTDWNTGDTFVVDLASPEGVVSVPDADTGDLVSIDFENLSGIIHIVDANTGEIVEIDFDNPSGTFYVRDENTGDLVLIDLSVDKFFKSGSLIIPSLGPSDTVAPTCTITMSDYALKIGDTATITFTFSEEVLNFTVADITAPNGSLSSFTVTGNPLVYTCTFTPTNGVTDLTNVITLGTSWTDLNGNPPSGSTTSSNYEVDTTAPTVTITCVLASPTETTPIPITITLSEVSTDFAIGDLTVGNGTAGNFAGSGTSYTADITPTAGGAVTVDIAANAFHDAAGNGNTAATQFSITFYDVKVNDAFTDANGTNLTAHTIAPTNVPGNAWTNIYTTGGRLLNVQSNRASCPAFNEGWYGLEVGASDFILTTILRLPSTTQVCGVYLRLDALTDAATTERNCWFVAFGNGKIELYERNAATPGTLRATANMTTNASQDYTIRAVVVDDTITVTVDGANQISYSGITTHLTSTKVGLRMVSPAGTTAIADDFKVFF